LFTFHHPSPKGTSIWVNSPWAFFRGIIKSSCFILKYWVLYIPILIGGTILSFYSSCKQLLQMYWILSIGNVLLQDWIPNSCIMGPITVLTHRSMLVLLTRVLEAIYSKSKITTGINSICFKKKNKVQDNSTVVLNNWTHQFFYGEKKCQSADSKTKSLFIVELASSVRNGCSWGPIERKEPFVDSILISWQLFPCWQSLMQEL
jgi:hypothetical protein